MTDEEIIKQITTVKGLMKFKTKDGVTDICQASKLLGSFQKHSAVYRASRYRKMPEINTFTEEAMAIDWIISD